MKYCADCKVFADVIANHCPLCGQNISTVPQSEERKRPVYPSFSIKQKSEKRFTFLAQIFLFISLLVIGVCTITNIFTWNGFFWAGIVNGGILIAWLLIGLPLISDLNLNHMLILQMFGVSFFLVYLDWLTGYKGWALSYVFPALYLLIAFVVALFCIIFRIVWKEYLITLIAMAILGLIPLLLIFSGKLTVLWPAVTAVFAAFMLVSGMLIFARDKIISVIRRRFDL